MNEQPDRLDRILNAAIRDYSNPEPRAGFERRILRRVQATPHRRFGSRFAWALLVPAVAAIVLIAFPARRVSPPVLALLPPPVPQAAASPPIPNPPPRTSGHRSRPRPENPEPPPMTAEERVLLRFVREQPEKARAILSQPAELEALTIEPLEIEEMH